MVVHHPDADNLLLIFHTNIDRLGLYKSFRRGKFLQDIPSCRDALQINRPRPRSPDRRQFPEFSCPAVRGLKPQGIVRKLHQTVSIRFTGIHLHPGRIEGNPGSG